MPGQQLDGCAALRSATSQAPSSDLVESSSACVLKLLLLPWWMRIGATDAAMNLTASLASVAEACGFGTALFAVINAYSRNMPHAPDVMYRNEVLFYRTVRRSLPASVEMPRVFGTVVDTERCMHGVCECIHACSLCPSQVATASITVADPVVDHGHIHARTQCRTT